MMLKKTAAFMIVIALLGLLLTPAAFAQSGMRWRGSGGWGPGTQYGRMYDPKTVETITGEVVRVDRMTPMRGMSTGVHLVLKTDTGELAVHLGPAWYVENQDVRIEPKDTVQVKGSRVTIQGQLAIIAAEVKKGDDTLKLRDEAGLPFWAGWRRG